jgi:hypothetical protein
MLMWTSGMRRYKVTKSLGQSKIHNTSGASTSPGVGVDFAGPDRHGHSL